LDTISFTSLPKPSSIRIERKGERVSPWKMLQEGEKVPKGEPLIRIEKKVEEMRDIIHLIYIGEKPKSLRTC
jgi:hypothetical protein